MLAIDALTFGTYVLQPFFPDSQTPPEVPVRLMAAVIIRECHLFYSFVFNCFVFIVCVLFHRFSCELCFVLCLHLLNCVCLCLIIGFYIFLVLICLSFYKLSAFLCMCVCVCVCVCVYNSTEL